MKIKTCQIHNNMLLSMDIEEKTTNNYPKIIIPCIAYHNRDINKFKVIHKNQVRYVVGFCTSNISFTTSKINFDNFHVKFDPKF